jgi:DNA-binding NtrC family response regulator
MKAAKCQSILIVEPDVQFREELHNFLLAAGYEMVTATDTLATVLDKIDLSAYDVILSDAGSLWDSKLEAAKNFAPMNPNMKIILMIEAEDQRIWGQCSVQMAGASFLIKSTFARNLLYLLANRAEP